MCEWRQELPCIWFSDAAERPFMLAHIYLVAKLLWSWILDAEARPYNWWLNFRGSSWTVLWRMMGSQQQRLVLGSVKQWSWLQQVYGRNLCTDLHKHRFCFLMSFPIRKAACLWIAEGSVFLLNIWRHLESSYCSRYAPTRGISADSILKSVMYNVLDAALQNLKVLSDASLRACAMRPQRGEVGSYIWHWALASFEGSLSKWERISKQSSRCESSWIHCCFPVPRSSVSEKGNY